MNDKVNPGDVFATLSWRMFETPIVGPRLTRGGTDHLAPGGQYAVMMFLGYLPREVAMDSRIARHAVNRLGFVPGEDHEAALRQIIAGAEMVGKMADALEALYASAAAHLDGTETAMQLATKCDEAAAFVAIVRKAQAATAAEQQADEAAAAGKEDLRSGRIVAASDDLARGSAKARVRAAFHAATKAGDRVVVKMATGLPWNRGEVREHAGSVEGRKYVFVDAFPDASGDETDDGSFVIDEGEIIDWMPEEEHDPSAPDGRKKKPEMRLIPGGDGR